MIAELFRYWTTLAPERVRKFGYLKRLIALEARARRCQSAWMPHVNRAHAFITKAAELVPQPRTAVILGSGLLIEVPLQTLADRFERVYLVDMFHMPVVRRLTRRHFNVKLLTGDVTGIFAMMKEGKSPGPLVPPPAPRIPHLADADLIVSCNCLTQLAGPFTDLFRKTRGFVDADSDTLAAQIMEKHVEAVALNAAGVGVILTDSERFAMQGEQLVSRVDLLKGVRLPQTPKPLQNEEWDWMIAPSPEEHPSHDMVHAIVGRIYERQSTSADAKAADGANDGELPVSADDGLADLPPMVTVPPIVSPGR